MPLLRHLTLPRSPKFRRPHNLVYADREQPPANAFVGLTIQHVATVLAFIAYTLAMAEMGQLDAKSTQYIISGTLLGMAIATILQAWGGRLGSGLLIIAQPDPLLVITGGVAVAHYGVSGLVVIGLLHGTVAMCAGVLMPKLRAILTPTIAGIIVCMAGVALIVPGLERMTGLGDASSIDMTAVGIATLTLVVIISMSVWGSNHAKLFALLAGIGIGIVASIGLGEVADTSIVSDTAWVGVPQMPSFNLDIDIGVLLAFAVLALMTQLDSFGSAVLMHKMNDADWRRPNMQLVGGAMRANGLGTLAAASFGAQPLATSSANIALCHISRTTSRYIGITTGLCLGLFAFIPKIAIALTMIPTPVIGAVTTYAAAYLMVSGLELITSRAMDARAIFVVGLSLTAGIGVMLLPTLTQAASPGINMIVSDGIVMAGLTAIFLNLIFRMGTSQKNAITIKPELELPIYQQVINFIEQQGAHWGARRDVITRAASASLEAIETLQSLPGHAPTQIQGTFDEFNFDVWIWHLGEPLDAKMERTSQAGPSLDLDLDEDAYLEALDRALESASGRLVSRLADKTTYGRQGEQSWIKLHFDH